MTARTKILLIDDEPLVRDELGGLLQDEGYEVICGVDGEEGLELFRRERPDLVITDVRMPRRDGLSVALTIREENPGVPVTVITGHGTESMAIEAIRAGVTDFIRKPVRLDDLTAAVARMEAARVPVALQMGEMPPSVRLVSHTWTYELGSDPEAIPAFVEAVLRHCAGDLDRAVTGDLRLALRELLLNAVEHGNLGITFSDKSAALEEGSLDRLVRARREQPDLARRRVRVEASREEHRVRVTIRDEGAGFDWQSLPDPTDASHLLSAHGRGILLAAMSVDELRFNERGNEVTIEKRYA